MSAFSMFTITYSYCESYGTWFAEDDYRHEGYLARRTTRKYYMVAPSEALARAHFQESNDWEFKNGPAMRIDAVEKQSVYAVLLGAVVR